MEEGVLEIPGDRAIRARWIGQSEEVVSIGEAFGMIYTLEGYRCKSCMCMLLDY